MATQKENFETHVSLSGVEQYQRGQKVIGAGWKALRGDLDGAAAGFKKLNLSTGQWLAVGAAAGGAGYKLMKGLGVATNAAMQAEAVQMKLRTALAANLGMSKEAADAMADYGSSLSAAAGVSPFGDEEINNAAAMLSTFGMGEAQLKKFLPAILDTATAFQKVTGETADLSQMSMMIGKAFGGNTTALRRFGIMVDETAIKTKGAEAAILEALQSKFGGQSAAAMTTAAGAVKGYNDSIGELQESIGDGLLPVVRSLANGGRAIANALTTMNNATHGAVGIVGALGATVAIGGALALVAVRSWRMLREEITGVAGAADRAAASLRTAGAAATTSGAAAAAGASATAGAAAGNAATAGASATAGAAGNAAAMGAGAAMGKAGAKGAMKGIGVAAIAGLIGGALSNVGRITPADVKKGQGRMAGRAAAGIGGAALQYGSMGAMLGSFVPGLGTAAGAAIGAAAGVGVGAYGAFSGRAAAEKEAAAAAKAAQVATVPKAGASKTDDLLQRILAATENQTKILVGGGARAANAANQGDIQRAIYGTLARAVV
jgi:hypothetical protein